MTDGGIRDTSIISILVCNSRRHKHGRTYPIGASTRTINIDDYLIGFFGRLEIDISLDQQRHKELLCTHSTTASFVLLRSMDEEKLNALLFFFFFFRAL